MTITEIPLEEYVELLESGEPFVQANLGDGEVGCILGEEGGNVNGETYEPELRDALRRTLIEHRPGVWYGLNPAKRQEEPFRRWCGENGVAIPWVAKDTISEGNVRGELAPFFAALRGRDVLLVANELVLEGLETRPRWPPSGPVIQPYGVVRIHPTQAWRTAAETATVIESMIDPGVVVLIAAGMATNLIVHEIMSRGNVTDEGVTLLDVGATLDPYAGLRTRKAYRRDEWWRTAYPRNLETSA